MEPLSNDGVTADVRLSRGELLTLRHCVVEALEALSEAEFRIRVGAPRADAERLLADLKSATSSRFWASDA